MNPGTIWRIRLAAWWQSGALKWGAVLVSALVVLQLAKCAAAANQRLTDRIDEKDRQIAAAARRTMAIDSARRAETAALRDSLAQLRRLRPSAMRAVARADSAERLLTFLRDTALAGDTVQYTQVRRATDDRAFTIPVFVAHLVTLQGAAIDSLERVTRAQDGALAAARVVVATDSAGINQRDSTIAAQRNAIALRDRRDRPRCRARCGFAAGVAATTAAAVAVTHPELLLKAAKWVVAGLR